MGDLEAEGSGFLGERVAHGVDLGQRVVVQPGVSCGYCPACKFGNPGSCENYSSLGVFRDGALAEFISVPAIQCHRISEEIPSEIAAMTEPLSCVMNGIEQSKPLAGEVAVIYGAGAIGLLFLSVLRANGVRCIVVEPSEARAATASAMGAHVSNPDPEALEAAVAELTTGGADIVVDAVGSQLGSAIVLARPKARILLFGFNTRALLPVQQSTITRKELVVFGTYVGENMFPAPSASWSPGSSISTQSFPASFRSKTACWHSTPCAAARWSSSSSR
jgi:threonine dehydrogenase-like Zn-dependent dehydrogenase